MPLPDSNRLRLLLIVAIVLGGLGFGLIDTTLSRYFKPFLAAPREGATAPDFTLSTLDGKSITLSNLRGQVVIVNLWIAWCLPCQAKMPTLNEVYQTYRDDSLVMLGVNSTIQDSESAARAFASEHQLDFPILLDHDGVVSHQYQLQSLPTTFFIDRDGIITSIIPGGPMSLFLIKSKIIPLLSKNSTP